MGSTQRNPAARLREHLKPGVVASAKYPVSRWIAKHGVSNIALEVIEECDPNAVSDREIFWISHYRAISSDLLNLSAGGLGSKVSPSPETREKISLSLREYYANRENPFKGKRHREESRRRMSIAATGRKLSDETRRKLSEVGLGRAVSEETRERLSELNRGENNPMYGKPGFWSGKKRSPETIEKISASHRGELSRFAKLTDADVRLILGMRGSDPNETGRRFGVSASTVRDIWAGRTWRHVKLEETD